MSAWCSVTRLAQCLVKKTNEPNYPIIRGLSDLAATSTRETSIYNAFLCRDGGHCNFNASQGKGAVWARKLYEVAQ